jgi:hypothetical protein
MKKIFFIFALITLAVTMKAQLSTGYIRGQITDPYTILQSPNPALSAADTVGRTRTTNFDFVISKQKPYFLAIQWRMDTLAAHVGVNKIRDSIQVAGSYDGLTFKRIPGLSTSWYGNVNSGKDTTGTFEYLSTKLSYSIIRFRVYGVAASVSSKIVGLVVVAKDGL